MCSHKVGMVQELERRGARVACTYTGGLDFSVPVQESEVCIIRGLDLFERNDQGVKQWILRRFLIGICQN